MAASTSRQPHEVPLPPSPALLLKSGKPSMSKKGKGKSREQPKPSQKRRVAVHPSTTPSSWDASETDSFWDWVSLTDSSASKATPTFTQDGSHFFSLVGSSVKIYSSATGQVVSTLSSPRIPGREASSDLLTSAILNPHNAFQLITGSLDGCLRVWDFLDAILLKTIDIAQPILRICAHENFKDTVFVASQRKTSSDDNAVVLRVSINSTEPNQSSAQKSPEITPIGKTRFPTGLAFSPSGTYLVATAGHKVYAAMSSSFQSGFTKYVSPERLTCLAFHPSEDYFATGDDKGNIRLWYCLNEQLAVKAVGVEKKTQTTSLHWHAHAVSSITFTSNGAYLLSGGEESVLVIWQLHTGRKEFVPRVGAPITTISMSNVKENGEEYLLTLADATYVFISAATLKINRSYCRIKLDPVANHEWSSSSKTAHPPLAVHSLTSTLILPSSHPSSLQIYSPSSSKLISELEVSPSNRVSRRDDKPLEPSRVERAVVSPSGEWMATVDVREGDDSFRGELYLKLWSWDPRSAQWTLNTRIDRPHGLESVTHVVFSPHSQYLVTTGADGNIKTWRLRSSGSKIVSSDDFWVARSTFSFRAAKPTHAAWSPDASLLAVSLGAHVALYDPITNALCRNLTNPGGKHIASAHFVGRGGRYLAVIGRHEVVVWDLVSQSVRWQHKGASVIDDLVPHPQNDSFALFHHVSSADHPRTKISLFQISSPVPSKTCSVPFGLLNLTWYSPCRSTPGFSFMGITRDWTVVIFGDDVQKPEGEDSAGIVADSSPQRRTLFQDIFGASAFADLSNRSWAEVTRGPADLPRPGHEGAANIFSGPSYLLPPLESLFAPLMHTVLKRHPTATSIPLGDDDPSAMQVDIQDESADVVTFGPHGKRRVEQKELDGLTELFKAHSVKAQVAGPPVRGISKSNNVAKSVKKNGGAQQSGPPLPTPQKAHPSKASIRGSVGSPESLPTSSPIVNGKKRKKSSG